MNLRNRFHLARLVTLSVFAAVVGGNWDVWWHGAVGRDSFWEPPHILLYVGIVAAIFLAGHGWLTFKDARWKWLTGALLLAPLAAPFDNLVHVTFGVEPVNSPWIIWSPPHLLLVFAIGFAAYQLLHLLRPDPDSASRLVFGALLFGMMLSTLLFTTIPVEPMGAQELIGFYGAMPIVFYIVLVLEGASLWMPGVGGPALAGVVLLFLSAISSTEKFAPGVLIAKHEHPPFWLLSFAFLLSATSLECTGKQQAVLRGLIAGVFFGVTLYCFAWQFLSEPFVYSSSDTIIGILSSMVGGAAAGFVVTLFETHRGSHKRRHLR